MGEDTGCLASQAGVRGQADTAKDVHWAGLTQGCTGNVPVSSTGGPGEGGEWNLLANFGSICKEVLRNNLRVDRGLGIFWGCGMGRYRVVPSTVNAEGQKDQVGGISFTVLPSVCSIPLRDAYAAGLMYFVFVYFVF